MLCGEKFSSKDELQSGFRRDACYASGDPGLLFCVEIAGL
jgi:hypothetical protein